MEAFHLISESKLDTFQKDLLLIKHLLNKKAEEQFKFNWIESKQVPGLLGISNRTWQSYRDKRIIPFSQFGSKIYVRLSDLNNFLEKHLISQK